MRVRVGTRGCEWVRVGTRVYGRLRAVMGGPNAGGSGGYEWVRMGSANGREWVRVGMRGYGGCAWAPARTHWNPFVPCANGYEWVRRMGTNGHAWVRVRTGSCGWERTHGYPFVPARMGNEWVRRMRTNGYVWARAGGRALIGTHSHRVRPDTNGCDEWVRTQLLRSNGH